MAKLKPRGAVGHKIAIATALVRRSSSVVHIFGRHSGVDLVVAII